MPIATFLNGGTVSQLRGLAWLALSETGYILTGTATSDQAGGRTVVWGTAGTVPCRIDPLTGGEQEAADQLADRSTHLITVPQNTPVDNDQRFKMLGKTWVITAVRAHAGETVRTVEVVEL